MSSGKWRPFCLGLNVLMQRSSEETKQNKTKQYRVAQNKNIQHRTNKTKQNVLLLHVSAARWRNNHAWVN